MKKENTISLAMIVKDEEAVLERCLKSIKDYVDEIIIVDTGSTDNTVEIAKKYATKVFYFEWIDDFAAARNFSFSKCTEDFILWVDGDDIILPEDGKKIRDLDLSDKDIVVFDYIYSHDEYGNSESTVPRERIFRRSLNLQWENEIHEVIPLSKPYYIADIELHHYRQGTTSERNLLILERIVKKHKKVEPRNIYYLAKEYYDSNKIESSIKYFKQYLKRQDGWWENKYEAMCYLAKCYRHKNMITDFKKWIFEGIKLEERTAEPYYLLGDYYFDNHQWEKAIHWYKICLTINRPKDLLASYRPEFITWKPHLQLCAAYNMLGNVKDAAYHNKEVLKYRPADQRAISNKRIFENISTEKKNGEGKRLNLGSGGKTIIGYTNVDIFNGPGIDEVFELDEIPYMDNTISAINSEHSLEHVGFDRSVKALREWFRVLVPGGELILKIPDLQQCCEEYIKRPVNSYERLWYKYTIYGVQKSQAGEPDEGQYHNSGYSKLEIESVLKGIGFVIDYCENYNGWDTPSVAIRAMKPISNMKIGWIAPINWDAAQIRIRVLNINRWLRARGYQSDIVNYPEIINQGYDVAIVGKSFDEHHYKNVKMLKQYGKTVFCDLCEDIVSYPWVDEIMATCDKVICCSHVLADKVKVINPNTVVIEDAIEV